MQIIPLPKKEAKSQEGVIAFLEALLKRAQAGQIEGLAVIAETVNGYEYTRVNMSFETAICLHARGIHKLQQDWDRS